MVNLKLEPGYFELTIHVFNPSIGCRWFCSLDLSEFGDCFHRCSNVLLSAYTGV